MQLTQKSQILFYLFNQLCFCDRYSHYLIVSFRIYEELIADNFYQLTVINLRYQYYFKVVQNFAEVFWKGTQVTYMCMTYGITFFLQLHRCAFYCSISTTPSNNKHFAFFLPAIKLL